MTRMDAFTLFTTLASGIAIWCFGVEIVISTIFAAFSLFVFGCLFACIIQQNFFPRPIPPL